MRSVKFSLKFICFLLLIHSFFIFSSIPAYGIPTSTKELSSSEKIIYLTFDDGPSVVTDKILDILKEYDVKATFFIIGNQIEGFEPTIKRIQDEGHNIGLHSYTHNFKTIYSSRKKFITEMKKCQDELYDITGVRYNVIRFPGGSTKRLSEEFLDQLHSEKFKIYDWNAYMSDGLNYKTSPHKLYKEATSTTVSKYPIVLLMHCDYTHKNTCIALPDIIKYYKNLGFEFKIITEETPELYFPIKVQK